MQFTHLTYYHHHHHHHHHHHIGIYTSRDDLEPTNLESVF
jgi:hypothetical protein